MNGLKQMKKVLWPFFLLTHFAFCFVSVFLNNLVELKNEFSNVFLSLWEFCNFSFSYLGCFLCTVTSMQQTICHLDLLFWVSFVPLEWILKVKKCQKHFFFNLSKKRTLVFCYKNCSDLLWEKNVLVIVKKIWNSRLKAENLQNFWDH